MGYKETYLSFYEVVVVHDAAEHIKAEQLIKAHGDGGSGGNIGHSNKIFQLTIVAPERNASSKLENADNAAKVEISLTIEMERFSSILISSMVKKN